MKSGRNNMKKPFFVVLTAKLIPISKKLDFFDFFMNFRFFPTLNHIKNHQKLVFFNFFSAKIPSKVFPKTLSEHFLPIPSGSWPRNSAPWKMDPLIKKILAGISASYPFKLFDGILLQWSIIKKWAEMIISQI